MKKITIKNKVLLKLFIGLLTITGCAQKTKVKKSSRISKAKQSKQATSNQKIAKEEHVITIWVHGTRLLHSVVFNKFFFRKIGLHPITSYKKENNVHKIASILHNQEAKRFDLQNFYIFGWNGKLSHKERKDSAKKLHRSIVKFIKKYKSKYGVTPKIRLITHSHGGNVALLLAKINEKKDTKIKIHELVLLACPVQKKTAHLIKDKMFEHVYSLYSGMDMLQVIDPQGITLHKGPVLEKRDLFSTRIFTPHKNLMQIKLKINGRGILHVEFLLKKFISLLPFIMEELDEWKKDESSSPHAYKKYLALKVKTKNGKISFDRKILRKKLKRASS